MKVTINLNDFTHYKISELSKELPDTTPEQFMEIIVCRFISGEFKDIGLNKVDKKLHKLQPSQWVKQYKEHLKEIKNA